MILIPLTRLVCQLVILIIHNNDPSISFKRVSLFHPSIICLGHSINRRVVFCVFSPSYLSITVRIYTRPMSTRDEAENLTTGKPGRCDGYSVGGVNLNTTIILNSY